MQRDVKLGLGVGLVLLLLCGFFFIKMQSSDKDQGAVDTDPMRPIMGIPEKAPEPEQSLEPKLPPEVTPGVPEPPIVEVEHPKEQMTLPPEPIAKVEEPVVEEPNTRVKIGNSTETTTEKIEKIEEDRAAEKPMVDERPTEPVFPIRTIVEPPIPIPKAPSHAGDEYIVEPGDTLSGIASEMMGSAKHWRALLEANRDKLSSPERLMVGMKLTIPEIAEEPKVKEEKLTDEPVLLPPTEAPEDEGDVHVVKKGETLSDIAERYLNDRNKWKTIAKANPGINPNRLRIGQKIKIPHQ